MIINYAPFFKKIQYTFNDQNLLIKALSHRSASKNNNERLEYLGDSILNFVISAILFKKFPYMDEGTLSRFRSSLVKEETLANIARDLEIGNYLILGMGELKSGGYRRDSILADTLEAILGAIYQDSCISTCYKFVENLFIEKLNSLEPELFDKDPKTRLQEYLQAKHLSLPVYDIIKFPSQNAPNENSNSEESLFLIQCSVQEIEGKILAEGSSIRKAEQKAAHLFYKRYCCHE